MSLLRLIFRGLRHHWRLHVAVSLGVAAATAVLTGALLVGDSMRWSLRRLTLDRLGKIDEVILSSRFFHAELTDQLCDSDSFQQHFESAAGVILLHGSAECRSIAGTVRRARGVSVLGCGESFWNFGSDRPGRLAGRREVVLNQPLADQLGAQIGDQIVLRIPKANQIPGESPLGRKSDTVGGLTGLTVVEIVPARGLGGFGLAFTQQLPLNAFVTTATLQDALEVPEKINAILVGGSQADRAPNEAASAALLSTLRPTLADYGLQLRRVRNVFRDTSGGEETIFDYYNLTTDRMLLSPAVDAAVENALAVDHAEPVLTYLANSIGKGKLPHRVLCGHLMTVQALTTPLISRGLSRFVQEERIADIPYSTVTAIQSTETLGPLVGADGMPIDVLGDREIVLNSWAAADLHAVIGDQIQITFFEPETTHGISREHTEQFTLKAIVPLTEPVEPYSDRKPAVFTQRPTPANDPDWTPVVEGLTDRQSLEDWDAPFPYDSRRIRDQDERYWDNHRTTPKAFISLATGRRIWGSERFGQTTSYRIPSNAGVTEDSLTNRISDQFDRDGLRPGFQFLPVKRHGLQAARGTTSFGSLFFGFSLFIIVSAMMLIALLFRLGIELRARELGILRAVGWKTLSIGRWLAVEGLVVSLVGGFIGILVGIGYAWLMLVGLRTWWLDAVTTPFLRLHVTTDEPTLLIGYAGGVGVALFTIFAALRQMQKISVLRLLSGQASEVRQIPTQVRQTATYVTIALLIVAIGLAIFATWLAGEAQAGAFFGSGALVLAAGLLALRHELRTGRFLAGLGNARGGMVKLALRNIGRNPGRSTLTIGLVAAATFLIVAISAFRLDPTREGAGGFSLVAESEQPIYFDLDSTNGRQQLGLIGDDEALLTESKTISLRIQPGDDASCLNLYQPRQPQVLGVPPALANYYKHNPQAVRFSWAEHAGETPEEMSNPWLLLDKQFEDGAVPVILDKNTAMYSMHLFAMKGTGTTFSIDYEDGRRIRYRIVGLLSNSIFQGNLLISDSSFTNLFPEVRGWRYFLINASRFEDLISRLENQLGDHGFDVQKTSEKLRGLLAVQNTYLSTFQSLGALGLLLGTFGLATIQWRNVLERRAELALLRATGFGRRRLAQMILLESVGLLLAGLATGVISAFVAVLPHEFYGGAEVPLASLTRLLGVILFVGVLAGLLAVRAALQAPLVSALRGD